MKKTTVLTSSAAILLVSCDACNNSNRTQREAVMGATGGALLKAILDSSVGNGQNNELGAVFGTVVGRAVSTVVGNQMDKQAKEIEEEIPGTEVRRVDDGIVVAFDGNSGVHFKTARHSINGKPKKALNKLIAVLKEYPETNVVAAGYTDSIGKDECNTGSSKRRAQSVTNYFASNGLAASRSTIKWFGEQNPIADNGTLEGRTKSRRISVVIVPNEKMKADVEKSASRN